MKELQSRIKKKLVEIIDQKYQTKVEKIEFSIPPQRKFGDLSTNLPFSLAKIARKAPFLVGKELIDLFGKDISMIERIEIAGGGFLNFFFKNDLLFDYLLDKKNQSPLKKNEKVVVEHTSINPNKAAHIGHLRNSIIGDTLALSLSHLGYEVEIQNYIDDTGIQVADVVWGLMKYKEMSEKDIFEMKNVASYLWTFYSEVSSMLAADDNLKKERDSVHQKIEEGIDPEYKICNFISQSVLIDHINVMEKLGIRYNLLVNESDIIKLGFFEDVKDLLVKNGIMFFSEDPEKKGCMVIKYKKENIEKIIIRSNGTLTYIAKDMAYAFWKMGLIEKSFTFKEFLTYKDGNTIKMTDHSKDECTDPGLDDFGGSNQVFNVIGIRQSYLQNIISQVIKDLSTKKKEYIHFFYEMVSLSPQCVKEMGIKVSEEELKKNSVDVSGRKGIGIKGEDLIEELFLRALKEVEIRNSELEQAEKEKIARAISTGALRYFMIKFNSTSQITFDFNEALSFEGNSGPYIQYSVVRINSIIRRMGQSEKDIFNNQKPDVNKLSAEEREYFMEILLLISRFELEIEFTIESRDLSILAAYVYKISQKLNHYYHLYPVLSEEDSVIKGTRTIFLAYVKQQMTLFTSLLGIPVPEKM